MIVWKSGIGIGHRDRGTMGSPATEAGRQSDEVLHEVTLTQGFWMAKTEATQEQWEAVMSGNPRPIKEYGEYEEGSVAESAGPSDGHFHVIGGGSLS
jgi:formylglycine-generating enzyme required for sulfatase activity